MTGGGVKGGGPPIPEFDSILAEANAYPPERQISICRAFGSKWMPDIIQCGWKPLTRSTTIISDEADEVYKMAWMGYKSVGITARPCSLRVLRNWRSVGKASGPNRVGC